MKKEVLCLWPVDDEQKSALIAAGAGKCTFRFCSPETVTRQQAQNAEIILGTIDADLIQHTSKLKWLQITSAGTDKYIASGKLSPDIKLTNATGAYGQSVAEHMFAVMFMLMKNLHLYRDNQNRALWADCGPVSTPDGARILIAGLGDIGGYFARLCKKVGAYTIGIKRHATNCPDFIDELYTDDKLDGLLPTVDVTVSVLPNTKDTTGLWDAQKFSRMKKTALFINAGRGNAVNQEDLYHALHNGILAGGNDVTVLRTAAPRFKTVVSPQSGHNAACSRRFSSCRYF